MSTTEPAYFRRYRTLALSRDDDGILLVRLRNAEGDSPVAYASEHHSDWSRAFVDIAADRENRVVIITGTGDAFIDVYAWDRSLGDPQRFDPVYFEGKHVLRRLLDIEVPVIGAVNGPATIHAEIAVMSDITIASSTAAFQDAAHVTAGAVPGDGVQVVWLELLGMNRGRYFLLTGQRLTADEALELGVVNEVVPPESVLPRAYEHARTLAALNPLVARYSRVVLTQRYKRRIDESLAFGLAHESLGVVDEARLRRIARQAANDGEPVSG